MYGPSIKQLYLTFVIMNLIPPPGKRRRVLKEEHLTGLVLQHLERITYSGGTKSLACMQGVFLMLHLYHFLVFFGIYSLA